MTGNHSIRFSDLFADTVATHGVLWAWGYYSKRGMCRSEFRVWMRSIRGVH